MLSGFDGNVSLTGVTDAQCVGDQLADSRALVHGRVEGLPAVEYIFDGLQAALLDGREQTVHDGLQVSGGIFGESGRRALFLLLLDHRRTAVAVWWVAGQ